MGAIARAQARGDSSAKALRRYRSNGGRISDHRWRDLWAEVRDHPEFFEDPWERERKVKQPGGVLYYVGLMVLDRETGSVDEWTWTVKRPRKSQREARRAIAEAFGMFDRTRLARGYGMAILGARILGVEKLVAE